MASGEQGYTRYLNGDKSGIDDIVREYNDSLIFFINGYVNDLMTAEDLAADTIVKLLVKLKKFKNDMAVYSRAQHRSRLAEKNSSSSAYAHLGQRTVRPAVV